MFFISYRQGSTITNLFSFYPTCLFKAMSQRGADSACGSSATAKNAQSWVWKHFTLERQSSAKEKFPPAKCRLCGKVVTRARGNTSNMNRHIQRDHGELCL